MESGEDAALCAATAAVRLDEPAPALAQEQAPAPAPSPAQETSQYSAAERREIVAMIDILNAVETTLARNAPTRAGREDEESGAPMAQSTPERSAARRAAVIARATDAGTALADMLDAAAALSLDARRATVARALPKALGAIKATVEHSVGAEIWSGEVDAAAFTGLAREWSELLSDGPVRVTRLSALLSPDTAGHIEHVLSLEEARWLRETAATDAAAIGRALESCAGTVPGDDGTRFARQFAHSCRLADGWLPGCVRVETERDTPQLHISAAQLLTPAGRLSALTLSAKVCAYLRSEAVFVLKQDSDNAGTQGAPRLAADVRTYLRELADGELPRGFVAETETSL